MEGCTNRNPGLLPPPFQEASRLGFREPGLVPRTRQADGQLCPVPGRGHSTAPPCLPIKVDGIGHRQVASPECHV